MNDAVINLENEIKALEKEIIELEEKKEELSFLREEREKTGKLSVVWLRGLEENINTSHIFRIGPFDRELLRKLPDYDSKWKNSIYDIHPSFCHSIITGTFRKEELHRYIDGEIRNPFAIWEKDKKYGQCAYYNFTNICVLEAVMPSQSGMILVLTDPYDSVVTEPVCDNIISDILPKEHIEDVLGSLFIVSLKMCKEKKEAVVCGMKKFPYPLYE